MSWRLPLQRLPDAILREIVSLPTSEGAPTQTTLAFRWRYIRHSSTLNLDRKWTWYHYRRPPRPFLVLERTRCWDHWCRLPPPFPLRHGCRSRARLQRPNLLQSLSSFASATLLDQLTGWRWRCNYCPASLSSWDAPSPSNCMEELAVLHNAVICRN